MDTANNIALIAQAMKQAEEDKCNSEIFKSVYNKNSMLPNIKYSKKKVKYSILMKKFIIFVI